MTARAQVPPPLVTGDRMADEEFLRRYYLMPGVKAELIEGEVVVASPVSVDHDDSTFGMRYLIGSYVALTPGVRGIGDATVRMRPGTIPQPDAGAYLPAALGGSMRVGLDRLYSGVPELVVEVAVSSVRRDRGRKRRAYERAGVAEYVIVLPRRREVEWLLNGPDGFVRMPPADDGTLRSRVFPGLWLDPGALFAYDLAAVRAAVERGCQPPDHAAFAARLRSAAGPEPAAAT